MRLLLLLYINLTIGTTNAEETPVVTEQEHVDVKNERHGPRDLVGDDSLHQNAFWGLEQSGFSTRTIISDTQGEKVSVADVAARSAGVRQVDLGGISSLSIRGGAANQTVLIVDGVPWSQLASASQDLGNTDLKNYSVITVERGAGQSALYSGGIGGTLILDSDLRYAGQKQVRFNATVGSFGAKKLGFRWLPFSESSKTRLSVASQYSFEEGDFTFFNDNGTNLNLGDDFFATRENNSRERIVLSLRAQRQVSNNLSMVGGMRALLRRQSLPGTTQNPAENASLSTVHPLMDFGIKKSDALSDGNEFGLNGFLSFEWSRYRDVDNEIGLLAQDQRYLTISPGLSGFWNKEWNRHLASQTRINYRYDKYFEENFQREELPQSEGHRHSLGIAFLPHVSLMNKKIEIQPGVRLDLLSTSPTSDRFDRDFSMPPTDNEVLFSPRVSFLFRASDWLSLKMNGGRYARPATFLELFGDRGFILGNPTLESERGWLADGGVVFASPLNSLGIDRLYVEGAVFAVSNENTIVYTSQNGFVSQAFNLEGATIRGTESALSFRVLKRFTANIAHTFLKTEIRSASFSGNSLPGRPDHQWTFRGDWAEEFGGVFVDAFMSLTWMTGNFLDRANAFELPERRLVDSGIKLGLGQDWLLSLQILNLLDNRIENIPLNPSPRDDLQSVPRALADTYGFPLPGRSFYLSTEYNY